MIRRKKISPSLLNENKNITASNSKYKQSSVLVFVVIVGQTQHIIQVT